MAEHSARKAQLIAELEEARAGIARSARGLKGSMNVGTHLKQAVSRQKTLWIGGALISGWLLTKLPGRKKKEAPKFIYAKAKEPDSKGFLLAALGLAGTLLRPVITSFVTQKLADLAERHQAESYPEPRPRANSSLR